MRTKNYTVYIHVNKTNNKVYVGITSQIPERRWRNGDGYYNNQYFYRAIKKYGWGGFNHVILFKNKTKEEAEELEILFIKVLMSNDNNYGYNIANGGNTTGKHSEETKQKISESQKGELNHMYGKKGLNNALAVSIICLTTNEIFHSIREAKEKYKINHIKDCCMNKINFNGYDENGNKLVWMVLKDYKNIPKDKLKEIIENKIKVANETIDTIKGKHNPNAKRITCINTGENFECMDDACKRYNINPSALTQAVKGDISFAGYNPETNEKLLWKYEDGMYLWKSKGTRNRKIRCLTTNEIFLSIKEASDKYDIDSSSIVSCCKGQLKSAGKHPSTNKRMIWEYDDELN